MKGRLTKNRNGACDTKLAFAIRAEEIGRDEDGDTVTAPICTPLNPNATNDAPKLKPTERAALTSIEEMMGQQDSLNEREWRAAAQDDARISAAEKPDSRRRVVSEALQGLVRHGLVELSSGRIRIPEGIDWDDGAEPDCRIGSDCDRINPDQSNRQNVGRNRIGSDCPL